MPSNTAAWLPSAKATLEVKSSPYNSPSPNEILLKTHAVAINPVDWAVQAMGPILFPHLSYPLVCGSDVAGEVVEVGSQVTRFKLGDRVVGHAMFMPEDSSSASGGFQTYTTLLVKMASPIPASLSYEAASVIPLGLSTAACALYQKDFLALPHPSLNPTPTNQTILVWGGSTSVGCNAIQLARSSGYNVITTSSPKNFAYMKRLGASHAFDYNDATAAIADILAVLEGSKEALAGAVAIGNVGSADRGATAANACVEIVEKATLCSKRFVAMTLHLPETLPTGVSAKFVMGSSLKDDEVGEAVYVEFLPRALEEGKFVAAPEPQVVGEGLECVQEAYEVQKKGVSAKKVVVTL